MAPETGFDLREIVSRFQLQGQLLDVMPYGTGHINDTYASRFQKTRGVARYIHQRINQNVFREPEKVMENMERVTRYARERILASGGDPQRETLNLVPAQDGLSFYRTPAGDTWRTCLFIEGVRTYDKVEDVRHAYSAANAFGKFQRLLSGLPGKRLHETIPNFHHTRKRFEAFVQACERDARNRACSVKTEIDFILKRQDDASVVVDMLAQGQLPERVTHNDTKLNNVLIDERTGEGICVIDLDTVMPGSALYDWGDLVRTAAITALEDELDLAKVSLDLGMFDRLAHGYLDATRDTLTPVEIDHLAFGAKLITFEQAIRFLGDYLSGDVYYKIHRQHHNLDRARTQIKMVAEIEQKMEHMMTIVNRYR
jgi:aminoglycoside phosphotransferase (APT) family kinase protein